MPARNRDHHLFVEKNMAAVEPYAFAGGCAVVYSSRCPNRSGLNEDAAVLLDCGGGRGVLAVADGAGGMKAGHTASRLATERLTRAVKLGQRNGMPLRESILEGFDRANTAVAALRGAATTLAVVQLGDRNRVRSYHAGDTPTLIIGGRGAIKLRTVDHSPVGFATEAGVLSEEDAMHHEYRHVISNFVGHAEMRIEMSASIGLAARDRVLIASDGLHDNLRHGEIVDIVRRGSLESAAAALAERCRERMHRPVRGQPCKPDDLTFILFSRAPRSRSRQS